MANVASVRLFRCHFESNTASDGGAIYIYSSSELMLSHCQFIANSAINHRQTTYASHGGALYAQTSSQLQVRDIDREFEFYEFFSFLKFNEFYDFFSVEKVP